MARRRWPQNSYVSADLSPDSVYRYSLSCSFRTMLARPKALPDWCYIMLNPSTADARFSDPTVDRCVRRALRADANGVMIVNLFAFRSPCPQAMKEHGSPIGERNDEAIRFAAMHASRVIVAWGNHGEHLRRADRVLEMLRELKITPYRIGSPTMGGHPRHPLYVADDEELEVHG